MRATLSAHASRDACCTQWVLRNDELNFETAIATYYLQRRSQPGW
jgi:hypothetical protein